MHILLTNDDGPPNPHTSPYIATFYRILTSAPFSHKVSVIVPSIQRSWIGKAHLIPPSTYAVPGQRDAGGKATSVSPNEVLDETVTPTFYDPTTEEVHNAPASSEQAARWVLVPGTPATCVQLGLFQKHLLFPSQHGEAPDFDLVISGPNYGRNTTAAFALSSGTLGGALEGAICGVKSIAISFAFFTRKEPESLVEEASTHAVQIVEKLVKDWTFSGNVVRASPDVFTINVPLVDHVSKKPVKWTWMLDNKWLAGSLYKAVEKNNAPVSFTWSPNFSDVWRTVEKSRPGNDGQVIREGCTSITALKANYQDLHTEGYNGELKL